MMSVRALQENEIFVVLREGRAAAFYHDYVYFLHFVDDVVGAALGDLEEL